MLQNNSKRRVKSVVSLSLVNVSLVTQLPPHKYERAYKKISDQFWVDQHREIVWVIITVKLIILNHTNFIKNAEERKLLNAMNRDCRFILFKKLMARKMM